MTTSPYVLLTVIFIAVLLATMGLFMLFAPRAAEQRLRRMVQPEAAPGDPDAWQSRVAEAAAPFAKFAQPVEEEQLSASRLLLVQAGFRGPSAIAVFYGLRAMLALGLPLFLLSIAIGAEARTDLIGLATFALSGASTGYYLPVWIVRFFARGRRREIFEALPPALDLMLVCIEAGMGMDAAIARVAQEIHVQSPTLAEELELVALEIRAGAPRDAALRHLAMRSGVEDMDSLVAMLVQADKFGTSIAESLRVHSDMMRTKRQQLAEEQAAKIPLKLLFPLIFFIFPSLLLVLLGPAMIRVYRILLPAMAGQ